MSTFGLYSDEAPRLLERAGFVVEKPDHKLSLEELWDIIGEYDAVIIGRERLPGDVIRKARRLKVIARYGVGFDNIDIKAATERGIAVVYTPGANHESVADLAMMLILMLARKALPAIESVRRGEWRKLDLVGIELQGKVLGIIGMGRIGAALARRAAAFGMRIIYYDKVRKPDVEAKVGATFTDLETLLRSSDFVSIHVPLTEETYHMIGERELRMMKRTAFLINTARGPVVDEQALIRALREGWIAGAALDVLEVEPPPPDHPLLELPNVIITPHIGAFTKEAIIRMDMMVARGIVDVFTKGYAPNVVNPSVLRQAQGLVPK